MSIYSFLGPDDIRLLTINTNKGQLVSLELRTYPRTAAPDYDAVSYAWGVDDSKVSVPCNGLFLEIRTALWRALPFINDFRPEPRTRSVWIDAICLDQANPEEKAIQVPRMGDVYENASRTVVWLGEAADDSDLAMTSIEVITEKMLEVHDPESSIALQKLDEYDLPPHHSEVWEAIKVLQLRPWFYRLWTLQEIVVSREAIVLCGRKSLPWESLLALQEAAYNALLNHYVNAKEPGSPYKLSMHMLTSVKWLREDRGRGMQLSTLLGMSKDRGYSLPVDRVWALIGMLSKNDQQKIRNAHLVDYSPAAVLNYHDTFLKIVKFYVKHDTRTAMRLIEDNFSFVQNPSLPSWVSDWHRERHEYPLMGGVEAAAGIPEGLDQSIKPFMLVTSDSVSLELCGLTVDAIDCVTTTTGQDLLHPESLSWILECHEIIKMKPFKRYDVYPVNVDRPAVPTNPQYILTSDEPSAQRRRAEAALIYFLYPPAVHLSSFDSSLLSCIGRKIFRSRGHRLGIGPADLKAGDLLCAMYGARTLWALRPLDANSTDGQSYTFVGSAYTPSLTKGQAWKGGSCEDMQRFRIK